MDLMVYLFVNYFAWGGMAILFPARRPRSRPLYSIIGKTHMALKIPVLAASGAACRMSVL